MSSRKNKNNTKKIILFIVVACLLAGLYLYLSHRPLIPPEDPAELTLIENTTQSETPSTQVTEQPSQTPQALSEFDLSQIPEYSGKPYVMVNNGTPFFTEDEITDKSFEEYSPLDNLGRCGVCTACIGQDIMPTEKRGDISSVKPTGWKNKEYDFVDGKHLYNRCHLIGFQLAGENANNRNLITGTRYLNVQGMLPFENMVADFVKETNEHVMYRVTPIFEGDNLVAAGVLMEAISVEDEGEEIMFNVFCYNVQPGVEIDYKTGNNWLADQKPLEGEIETFILNKNSKKFHLPSCENAINISAKNRQEVETTYENMIQQGYDPCGKCLKGR